jgi:hypothetical protein
MNHTHTHTDTFSDNAPWNLIKTHREKELILLIAVTTITALNGSSFTFSGK